MTRGGAREGAGAKPKDPSGPARMASYRLPPSTIDAIRELAEAEGVSQADVITKAITAYREGRPPALPAD